MASLMNLALVAGQLGTKYLNLLFPVQRGDYAELGVLMIVARGPRVPDPALGDRAVRAEDLKARGRPAGHARIS